MIEKTLVNVVLVISGDMFDLQAVTNLLEINPTSQWKKGDIIIKTPSTNPNVFTDTSVVRTRKFTNWCMETGFEESFDISDQAEKFLKIIGNKRKELFQIQKEANVEIQIVFVVNVYNDMRPALAINQDLISFAYACNASIEIDLYLY